MYIGSNKNTLAKELTIISPTIPIQRPIIALFLVLLYLYINADGITMVAVHKKSASSPTPPVCVPKRCKSDLINPTNTPDIGPNIKPASNAGTVEKSNFKNGGRNGSGNSNIIISTYDTPASIQTVVSFFVFCFIL